MSGGGTAGRPCAGPAPSPRQPPARPLTRARPAPPEQAGSQDRQHQLRQYRRQRSAQTRLGQTGSEQHRSQRRASPPEPRPPSRGPPSPPGRPPGCAARLSRTTAPGAVAWRAGVRDSRPADAARAADLDCPRPRPTSPWRRLDGATLGHCSTYGHVNSSETTYCHTVTTLGNRVGALCNDTPLTSVSAAPKFTICHIFARLRSIQTPLAVT